MACIDFSNNKIMHQRHWQYCHYIVPILFLLYDFVALLKRQGVNVKGLLKADTIKEEPQPYIDCTGHLQVVCTAYHPWKPIFLDISFLGFTSIYFLLVLYPLGNWFLLMTESFRIIITRPLKLLLSLILKMGHRNEKQNMSCSTWKLYSILYLGYVKLWLLYIYFE